MEYDVRRNKQEITSIKFANSSKEPSIDTICEKPNIGIVLFDQSEFDDSGLILANSDYENFIAALKKAEELGWLPKVLTAINTRTILQE